MTSRLHRDPSKFTEGADERLQTQLQLYKTPASIRELKSVNLYLSISAPRRPLLGRLVAGTNYTQPINAPSPTNKRYKYFEEPCLVAWPFGIEYNGNSGGATYPPKMTGTNVQFLNKQQTRYPYLTNCIEAPPQNTSASQTYLPQAYNNPPVATTNPNTAVSYHGPVQSNPVGIMGNLGYRKFYPTFFEYDPPEPFPRPNQYSTVGYPDVFGSGLPTLTNDVNRQVEASALYDIFDLIGTEADIDLTPFMSQLTDIKVSSDKVVYQITLESVQVSSDGRALASSRLISNGAENIEQYLKDKTDPEPDSVAGAFNEIFLYTTPGFGYPNLFQPRPVIAQPINVAIKEFATPNNPIQFTANSNEGYSLDKSGGDILHFGKWPWSKLSIQFGHYLHKPIGDVTKKENEVKNMGFYDANNEWFGDNSVGGTFQPVFYNQQINRIEFRFSVKIISLF